MVSNDRPVVARSPRTMAPAFVLAVAHQAEMQVAKLSHRDSGLCLLSITTSSKRWANALQKSMKVQRLVHTGDAI